jgi:hypothetical protein
MKSRNTRRIWKRQPGCQFAGGFSAGAALSGGGAKSTISLPRNVTAGQ